MHLTVEFDREADGRWIADVIDLPGAMAYGRTQAEALATVKALALRILADKLEHGELPTELGGLSFGVEAA
jgi:predicted RNase H-like HicB family nuclease